MLKNSGVDTPEMFYFVEAGGGYINALGQRVRA